MHTADIKCMLIPMSGIHETNAVPIPSMLPFALICDEYAKTIVIICKTIIIKGTIPNDEIDRITPKNGIASISSSAPVTHFKILIVSFKKQFLLMLF